MKALTLITINGFTFLAHGWADREGKNIVIGCFPSGEKDRYPKHTFHPFDNDDLDKVHEINFNAIKK